MQAIKKTIVTFLLSGVLFAPLAMQWGHMLDNHQAEKLCGESRLHIHAQELPCPIGATFTLPFFEEVAFWTYATPAVLSEEKPRLFSFFFSSRSVTSPSPRGPPMVLFA